MYSMFVAVMAFFAKVNFLSCISIMYILLNEILCVHVRLAILPSAEPT